MSPETQDQHRQRRSRELGKSTKADLCALYRRLGGMGGVHPPEKWYKEEVIGSILEIEWRRLPEEAKAPDPIRLTPPCDVCGGGEGASAHRSGGAHNYQYTHDPDKEWVPYEQEPATDARTRLELAKILEKGGAVSLGTKEARAAWIDGIPEMVGLIMRHFTPEEIQTILEGTE